MARFDDVGLEAAINAVLTTPSSVPVYAPL
jgi:hypothetical protein